MRIQRTDSNNTAFQQLVIALDKDLTSRYEERQALYDQYNKVPDLSTVVVAFIDDEPAGCGAFRHFDDDSVEVKRMFVSPAHRGKGLAKAILHELEQWALSLGYTTAVLETGNKQHEAIALYQQQGYSITPNYGQYVGLDSSICMMKPLV